MIRSLDDHPVLISRSVCLYPRPRVPQFRQQSILFVRVLLLHSATHRSRERSGSIHGIRGIRVRRWDNYTSPKESYKRVHPSASRADCYQTMESPLNRHFNGRTRVQRDKESENMYSLSAQIFFHRSNVRGRDLQSPVKAERHRATIARRRRRRTLE